MLFFVVVNLIGNIFPLEAIELNQTGFRHEVLRSDKTYFIMFHRSDCHECDKAAPEVDKLADQMKTIGIGVGKISLDEYPQFSKAYKVYSTPTMMLFRPHKEQLTYKGSNLFAPMSKWILENQLGGRETPQLKDDEKVDQFFSQSEKKPRFLMLSEENMIPPPFKEFCFRQRKTVKCAFACPKYPQYQTVIQKLKDIQNVDIASSDNPVIYAIHTPSDNDNDKKLNISIYNDGMVFNWLTEFYYKIVPSAKPKVIAPNNDESSSTENNNQKNDL
ncbi:Protein disulfide-isomerase [Monocercomonoides exilis]|uniref:Protein disulfide-isomerase n=1 Tax=Monocercomonoides exilis TaxID=2049356 RepID=UPI003559DC69|nr:Protein disulfide-isomerase [Monocercomonoides exilis]|eukprot:MONOS_156.1-p1 / transcript=MONOS_156.1 / gene=MONOS_156 / organism=Monocercomonoides_exilis_PA203 / gene_product=Protein disulfide-isomerase / transcript_product=Protein disulfide-isomerase / location=Mono_scaffold00003:51229-52102(+) / protein_length=274 / sequence_SO=supercontig / SO=protein_coding / is_pseudo=false